MRGYFSPIGRSFAPMDIWAQKKGVLIRLHALTEKEGLTALIPFRISCTSKTLLTSWDVFFIFFALLSKLKPPENKKPQLSPGFYLQRRRDSNPRNLAVQRFSRPPHSTTLPLLFKSPSGLSRTGLQRYIHFFFLGIADNKILETSRSICDRQVYQLS